MTELATLASESRSRAQGFWVPRFEIAIDGVQLENAVLRDVTEVTYKDNIDQIDGFELVVGNWDSKRNRFKYMGSEGDEQSRNDTALRELETLFEPCQKRVALKLGYAGDLTEIMTGTFTTMEPTFSSGGPHTLAVRALNILHRLRRKKYDGHWPNSRMSTVRDSDIAKSFEGLTDPEWRNRGQDARRIPMPIEIDTAARSREPQLVFVGQKNEYDIDFLWRRARVRSYVVEVRRPPNPWRPERDEEFLYFGPSTSQSGPIDYQLAWGSGLIDLKVTLTTATQVKKVTVKGWDRVRQQPIEVSVDRDAPELRGLNPGLSEIVNQCDPREERVVTRPIFTEDEARQLARDMLLGNARELVKVQGTTIGLPNLRAGSKIHLANIGGRLSGVYFVTETTHTFNQSGYITKFSARREDPDTGVRL
ncbi:phage late control D family protein [Nitrospira sp. BLG_1]|uniref:phage late control D family protein n=1 Tax=Nitrospira sp. BLG_1 TaxID=3395883 RepID=UPI0039BC85C6